MQPQIYWVDGPWPGRLGIAARPRGGDWLDDDVAAWQHAGIDVVVSLLEAAEADHFELGAEGPTVVAHGLTFVSHPFPDRGVPSSRTSFEQLLDELVVDVRSGRDVVIHCRQSIGRSSLIAVGMLVMEGRSTTQAISDVASARGVTVPETEDQQRWIETFALARSR